MIGKKHSDDIFQISIGMYCSTALKDEGIEMTIQEKRQIRLFLQAFDTSDEQQLIQANRWLDELAEEIWHITGFGVYQATLTTHQHEKPLKLLKKSYEYPPATRQAYLFSIEFVFSAGNQRFSLPYAYPTYAKFPRISVSVGRLRESLYRIDRTKSDGLFATDPVFRRFVHRFENTGAFSVYFFKHQTYHHYQQLHGFYISALSKSRQSVRQKGRQKVRKKIKAYQRQQEKTQAQIRKAQGKPAIPEKIYLIGTTDHQYKVGVSIHPKSRLRGLQTSHPQKLTLIHTFPAEPGKEAEDKLHRFFHQERLEGEWFLLTETQRQFIESITEYTDGKFLSQTTDQRLVKLNTL
jgi:hypothetical protein